MADTQASSPEARELSHLRDQLAGLRTELLDLAFVLERRGRIDAADVALIASARVGTLCEPSCESSGADRRRP